MTLNGYDDITEGYNTVIKNGEDSDANLLKGTMIPLGAVIAFDKADRVKTTGTANGNTTDYLVDTTKDFVALGITENSYVLNTSTGAWAVVDNVATTQLLLRADVRAGSSTTDIFPLGTENYTLYGVLELPDAFTEMNGQTLVDADSPYNGVTMRDMNVTQKFIRGNVTSGTTGGSDAKTWTTGAPSASVEVNGTVGANEYPSTGTHTHTITNADIIPAHIEMVWIKRIK